MAFEEENKQAIVDYLMTGCKGNAMGNIGVEMEHFILDEDGDAVPYQEKNGRVGVADILEKLAEFYPNKTFTPEGALVGLARPSATITIEPAAQIELSMAPVSSVAAAESEYETFLYRMKQICKPLDYTVCTCGYHPSAKAAELTLIPKKRYEFMDAYFASLPGMHGERMMRATTSLQVSLDFASEADAVRKTRIATILGPILAFICDNCPVFEGEPNPQALRRLRVWREVDPARCGVIPGLFSEGFGFERYAEWLLSIPVIFTTRDGEETPTGATPAGEVYGAAPMHLAGVEHLLSMIWPDVRLKTYVEVRQADSLPPAPAFGYAALLKGLFYGQFSLDLIEGKLGIGDDGLWPYTEDSVEEAIAAIVADGGKAVVYGSTVNDWVDFLFNIASQGLGTEFSYLEGLKDFIGL